jgi:hypothetical protein
MCCLSCSTERCAGQRLALQNGEPSLDLIESRGARQRKVECYKRVAFQPFVVHLVCVQIVEDDLEPCRWIAPLQR